MKKPVANDGLFHVHKKKPRRWLGGVAFAREKPDCVTNLTLHGSG